jgi:hypothetical protein
VDTSKLVAVDPGPPGAIYVAGQDKMSGQQTAITVWKYTPDGGPVWTRKWSSGVAGAPSTHYATAIAFTRVAGVGLIAVTGVASGPTGLDYATTVYYESGTCAWCTGDNQPYFAIYNGPGNGDDIPVDVGFEGGNQGDPAAIYVTGRSVGLGTGIDFLTIKYDGSTAGEVWSLRYANDFPTGADFGRDIDVARDANTGAIRVFVTGESYRGTNGWDFATVAYDAAGGSAFGLPWPRYFDSNAGEFWEDRPVAIVAGTRNDLYVTGLSYNGINFDYRTIGYNADGTDRWSSPSSSIIYDNGGDDTASGIGLLVNSTCESLPSPIVVGRSAGSSGNNYAVIRYIQTATPPGFCPP